MREAVIRLKYRPLSRATSHGNFIVMYQYHHLDHHLDVIVIENTVLDLQYTY